MVLRLLYIANLPVTLDTITAIYTADDTAIPTQGSQRSYRDIPAFTRKPFLHPDMAKKMENQRQNGAKSVQVTFTTRRKTCPPVILNGPRIPRAEDARYLGLYLDHRLNRRKHIFTERKQLRIQLNKMYRLLDSSCRSKINYCCTKQSLNQYRLTVLNFGAQPSIQTWK